MKRRGNQWVAIIELDPDPATGRRRQRQGGSFPTRRAAQEALAEMISGHWVAPAQMTLADYLQDDWLPSRAHRAGATRQQYAWAVGRLVDRLGRTRLSRLTPRMVQQLHADLLSEGLSTTSVQLVGKVLRMALGDAVKRELIPRNPATVVALPGVRRSEIECWSREETLAFLGSEVVRADRLQALWRLAQATGLRRGELVAIRWRDLDVPEERLFVRQAAALDGYTVSFGPPRSRAAVRTIALDRETLDALIAWRAVQADELRLLGYEPELLFTSPDGRAIHPQTLSRTWDRMVRAAGVEVVTLHGARHTPATLLLLTGVPLKVISERLARILHRAV